MRGTTTRFGGATALEDVDLGMQAGKVLAIVGDNGAGKSTPIKILTGAYQPTAGEMTMEGRPLPMASHADAIARASMPSTRRGRWPTA
jgi:ABC-type sugar transport system ATPase subunit